MDGPRAGTLGRSCVFVWIGILLQNSTGRGLLNMDHCVGRFAVFVTTLLRRCVSTDPVGNQPCGRARVEPHQYRYICVPAPPGDLNLNLNLNFLPVHAQYSWDSL